MVSEGDLSCRSGHRISTAARFPGGRRPPVCRRAANAAESRDRRRRSVPMPDRDVQHLRRLDGQGSSSNGRSSNSSGSSRPSPGCLGRPSSRGEASIAPRLRPQAPFSVPAPRWVREAVAAHPPLPFASIPIKAGGPSHGAPCSSSRSLRDRPFHSPCRGAKPTPLPPVGRQASPACRSPAIRKLHEGPEICRLVMEPHPDIATAVGPQVVGKRRRHCGPSV